VAGSGPVITWTVRLASVLLSLALASCGRIGFDLGTRVESGDDGGDGGGGDGNTSTNTNVMFVTSTAVVPASIGGIAGADTECASRAAAAGITGNFVAWLSTSVQPAADRLAGARGWIRTDGRPFVDSVADLLSSRLLNSAAADETGVLIPDGSYVITGTANDGTALSTCNDYQAGGMYGTYGLAHDGWSTWTYFINSGCGLAGNIYCFQIDHARPLTALPPPQRYAFVSAGMYAPGSGLAGADALCTSDANASLLPGSYRALLATNTATAASRFTLGVPWGRPDGVIVLDDLTQALAPISEQADGTVVPGGYVWVGAATPQTIGSNATTCNNWSVNNVNFSGDIAAASTTGGSALYAAIGACGVSLAHVICLQQ